MKMAAEDSEPSRELDDTLAIQTFKLTKKFESLIAVDGIDLDIKISNISCDIVL